MKTTRTYPFLFCLLFVSTAFSQTTQTIRGNVVDRITSQPVPKATVTLENTDYKTITDETGAFILQTIPTNRYTLTVSSVGFSTKKIAELLLQSGKELVLTVELSPTTTQLLEVSVSAASPNLSGALTSINTITTEQVMRFPATFLDPARLAQSFAGVTIGNDQANGISVRGNSPNSLQWRLEGVEIVNPNHTSNAGTFSDLPTAAGGGVNILSAQLLGNMNFLSGAFPAEYGNVLGGVLDMRLRKGNNKKREYTAQVGLIGIDVAAEGPFSNNSKASYLINYRYSFTGLLGLAGIDFGGEAIDFQDLSFNISVPTQKLGDFTLFGMGGKSNNIFRNPEDKAEWEEEKDQFDIDFRSKMGAMGVTHEKSFINALWRNVIAYSGTSSERQQFGGADLLPGFSIPRRNGLEKTLLTFNSSYQRRFSFNNDFKIGAFVTQQHDEIVTPQRTASLDGTVYQPYVTSTFRSKDGRFTTNFGLHFLYYSTTDDATLEPRISVGYEVKNRYSFGVAYGLHSQLQMPQIYTAANNNNFAGVSKSQHLVVNYQHFLSPSSSIKTEIFYQRLFNIPVANFNNAPILPTSSAINIIENPAMGVMYRNFGKGTNYGVELTYQKYLTEGFFVLTNATLYNSTFEIDGKAYDTRFNGKYIFNATLGKEWTKTKNRTWGVNGRVVWLGGFRDTPIDLAKSRENQTTVYEENVPFTIKQPDYFRPDLRIYFRKSKEKYSRMLSIDIQNVANYENTAFTYYDNFLDEIITKKQLGLIPMINYRWEF